MKTTNPFAVEKFYICDCGVEHNGYLLMRLPCDRPVNLSFAPCPMCRYEETAERIGSQCIAPVEQRKTVMLGLAFVFAAVGLTILAGMAVLIGRGI